MNLKKFISLLFIMLLGASSFVFAANNKRDVYSVYSDNFNGAHMYGFDDSVPTSDADGIKFYPWDTKDWEPATPHVIMSAISVDSTDSDPAPEGEQYIRYLWGSVEQSYSTTYVGCSYTCISGISSKSSINMSAYAGGKLKFSARSNKEYAKKCKIGFELANGTQSWFPTTLTNINENWQEFSFDLPSNIGDVSVIFMMMIDGESPHTVGEAFLDIDNIRWVKQNAGQTFSVVRKKVSDNTEAGQQKITFSSSTFGQGWSVAEQYLELDIDGEMQSNNWSIRVYTNNDKAGLYNGSDVLPTVWRVSCSTLPYTTSDNYDSLEIGETWNTGHTELYGLHDAGKVRVKGEGALYWFPWFWFKNSTDGPTAVDSIVWCYKGCCTFANTPEGKTKPEYYYDSLTNFHERKPKLFFACKTSEARGVKYTAQFVFNLEYE